LYPFHTGSGGFTSSRTPLLHKLGRGEPVSFNLLVTRKAYMEWNILCLKGIISRDHKLQIFS
jgi:hypothetical protein